MDFNSKLGDVAAEADLVVVVKDSQSVVLRRIPGTELIEKVTHAGELAYDQTGPMNYIAKVSFDLNAPEVEINAIDV